MDDDLVNEVREELGRCVWVKRLKIRVQGSENSIRLTGEFTSFYCKQVAQETVMKVLRRRKSSVNLQNDIAVLYTCGKSA